MNQVKSEASRMGASVVSISTEVSTITAGKGAEAVSSLKSLLKPQLPKKVKLKKGEVKKIGRGREKPGFPWNIMPIVTLLSNLVVKPKIGEERKR